MSGPPKAKRGGAPKRGARSKTTGTSRRGATRSRAPARSAARRADFGAPIEGFLRRQPPELRAILDALRRIVEAEAPDATASMKWGIPFFSIGGEMMCALGAHRAHVNLILPGPTGTYPDPERRLEGESRNGRHLKLRSLRELPRDAARRWIHIAAERARGKAAGG